jgi:hypothetical protein
LSPRCHFTARRLNFAVAGHGDSEWMRSVTSNFVESLRFKAPARRANMGGGKSEQRPRATKACSFEGRWRTRRCATQPPRLLLAAGAAALASARRTEVLRERKRGRNLSQLKLTRSRGLYRAPGASMASARPAAAPPRSSAGDKEVNVQVLLRCRRVCRHLHTTDCLSAVRPRSGSPARRAPLVQQTHQRRGGEAARAASGQVQRHRTRGVRACDRALRCAESAP